MIDVLLLAERAGADANRAFGKRAQGPMNVRSAVQTGTNGHLKGLVENAADLGRRQLLGPKTQRADAPAGISVAEHLILRHFVQPPPQPLRQLHLVSVDLGHALFLDILDPSGESGDAEHVGGAAFEEIRKLSRLRFAGRVAAGAAFPPGANLGAGPDIESACSCWAQ